MPRSITIDNVKLLRVQAFQEDATGEVHVFAEYELRSGTTAVQTVHRNLTAQVTAARKATVLAVLQGLALDVAAMEQI